MNYTSLCLSLYVIISIMTELGHATGFDQWRTSKSDAGGTGLICACTWNLFSGHAHYCDTPF